MNKNRIGTEMFILFVSSYLLCFCDSARELLSTPFLTCLFSSGLFGFVHKEFIYIYIYIYRVSQEECARLREGVPYVKVYRCNPKHLCPKLNGYGDNGQ